MLYYFSCDEIASDDYEGGDFAEHQTVEDLFGATGEGNVGLAYLDCMLMLRFSRRRLCWL